MSVPMKVVVAGSRDFCDKHLLFKCLDELLPENKGPYVIVSGGARGADRLGEEYAKERGYELLVKPADWKTRGKKAGFLRNIEMAKESDMLVAFWDGQSMGTKHMIDLAHHYNLHVKVITRE